MTGYWMREENCVGRKNPDGGERTIENEGNPTMHKAGRRNGGGGSDVGGIYQLKERECLERSH